MTKLYGIDYVQKRVYRTVPNLIKLAEQTKLYGIDYVQNGVYWTFPSLIKLVEQTKLYEIDYVCLSDSSKFDKISPIHKII